MTETMKNTDDFLPLKAAVHMILVALAEAPRHGYDIVKFVREESGGRIKLATGPLYRHMHRLLEQGLVEERESSVADDDARRIYYGPTLLGLTVLAAENARLAQLVARVSQLGLPRVTGE